MIISGKILHLNAITHDGKVVFFGVDPDGVIWYSVKRSGFEDTSLTDASDPFGFDAWKQLILGVSVADPSVAADELANLTDGQGKHLVRSCFDDGTWVHELVKTVQAPVQLVSAFGYIYVFRQAFTNRQILVSRFVLDGMKNELVPRLEVRFRRSKQRFKAEAPAGTDASALARADSLDFRDMAGNPFYEPTTCLSFVAPTASGWFTVAWVPNDGGRGRWHIVAHDPAIGKLALYSVAATEGGLFDVKDQLIAARTGDETTFRAMAGIVRRILDLQNLTVAGRPALVVYDLQSERQTKTGPQLVRDATRVMLTVPVKEGGQTVATVAALGFSLGGDGTLSQIDPTPDAIETLRSRTREVLLPIDELDQIKAIGLSNPPPAGVVAGMRRGTDDLLQIDSKSGVGGVAVGDPIRLSGTQSYDGNYRVVAVDGATFTIEATFTASEPGYWAVVPEQETGLVFDNMVLGYEKTVDGKLKVACSTHDLIVGDDVQLVGTDSHDDTVKVVAVDGQGFTLDVAWRPGEAKNLRKVQRRGLAFDGVDDLLETPPLDMTLPGAPSQPFGRTVQAWIKVPVLQSRAQRIVSGEDDLLELSLTAANKVQLSAHLSDGTTRTVVDPNPVVAGQWLHFAGTVDYDLAAGGHTRLFLCRNGAKVTPVAAAGEWLEDRTKVIGRETPGHLGGELLAFDGVDDEVRVSGFSSPLTNRSFTVELWARRERSGTYEWLVNHGADQANQAIIIGFRDTNAFAFSFYNNDLDTPTTYTDTRWHHFACTFDHLTRTQRIYCDGALVASRVAPANFQGSGDLNIGRKLDGSWGFKGQLADVRVWDRARGEDELRADALRRLTGTEAGLVGYWPLEGRLVADRSPRKKHGTLGGNPTWRPSVYRLPAVTVYGAAEFTAASDYFKCPGPRLDNRSFSISFWARRAPNSGGATRMMIGQGATSTRIGLHIGFRSNSVFTFAFYADDLDTPVGYTDLEWHHYCCTFNVQSKQRVIYRDGVQVAAAAAGGAYAGAGELFIGRGPAGGDTFLGAVAEVRVWDRELTADEAKIDMWTCPTGTEAGLLGYWPLDDGLARDLSPRKAHGQPCGAPRPVALCHTIAGARGNLSTCFAGELADVRLWDRPVGERELKDTMNLLLTGKEDGLAAYYRLGAVVAEDPAAPIVPDLSAASSHARVYGAPYGGSRRLERATAGGQRAVKYSHSSLIAVQQLGTYEERFEFKVTAPDPGFNPANVDGLGNRLFTFAYWGRRSAAADEVLRLPSSCAQQADFQSLGGGWYLASCRVTIPDGVPLLRAFEIADVRGRWTGDVMPGDEWTAIDIRRHTLCLVSDSVSRETYTDVVAPARIASPAGVATGPLSAAEGKVAALYARIRDLVERIDVAQNISRYTAEKSLLDSQVAALSTQLNSAWSALANQRIHLGNHRMILKNVGNGNYLIPSGVLTVAVVTIYVDNASDAFVWEGEYIDENWCYFRPRRFANCNLALVPGATANGGPVVLFPQGTNYEQQWRASERSGDNYCIYSRQGSGVMEVGAYSKAPLCPIQVWSQAWHDWQRWRAEKMEVTAAGAQRIKDAEARVASLESSIAEKQARINQLVPLLANAESVASLQSALQAARTDLNNAWTEFNTANTAALGALAAGSAVAMTRVACDADERITDAALLDFIRPVGGVQALATCEGNVQLAYVDTRGRLRATVFDAVADSRNTTFEQWLLDRDRGCVDCRDAADRLTLSTPVELPGDTWTFETWFQYPPVGKPDGTPFDYSVLIGSDAVRFEAPLCLRGGNRLGTLAGGFFHDSGANLDRTLVPGWHHAAAVARGNRTDFYLDGEQAGSATQIRNALAFNGADNYVEVPPLGQSFAQGVTAEAWVFLDQPAQASVARGIFTDTETHGGDTVQFHLSVTGPNHQLQAGFLGSGWQLVVDPAGLPMNRWVHVAATYDGHYITLFRDGVIVATSGDLNRALPVDNDTWRIGRRHDAGTPDSMWRGAITEVRLWSAPRSAAELRAGMYAQLAGSEGNLVGYWPMTTFDDGGARKVKDLGPLKKHGAIVGTPEVVVLAPQSRGPLTTLGNLGGGGYPAGKLAEARLWRADLSAAEVDAVSKLGVTGNEPELIACWPLREATGPTTAERVAGNTATLVGADWEACSANIGNPGHAVGAFGGAADVRCSGLNLANRSFSVELWARRERSGLVEIFAYQGNDGTNTALHVGFRDSNVFMFAFYANDLDTAATYTDTEWHHWACTYDAATKQQRIYRDGEVVATRTALAHFQGTGVLTIGRRTDSGSAFKGQLAEVRVWDRARTQDEVRAGMRLRLTGNEAGLLGLWPLAAETAGTTPDLSPNQRHGALTRVSFLRTTDLPLAGGVDVVSAEYTTVGVSADGTQQGLMRRCFGVAQGGGTRFVHDARVEALTLQWIGNAQFKPTLLGYIEGAPPVPSENLVYDEMGNYVDATSVVLTQSENVQYRWERSESTGAAFNMDLFAGVAWGVEGGIGIVTKISEGQAGARAFYNFSRTESRSSAVTAGSTLTTSDAIALRGAWEERPAFPHLGRRFLPKNVGYALVVSGLADVFVLKLQRSGRMVGYEVKPVEGMPLDINTITFMINPAYTYNGSLDGMIGSSPADQRFFGHVPAMRAQYGSLYPASYFRLKEAYDLAAAIDRKDKERETFFMNFDAMNVDQVGVAAEGDAEGYGQSGEGGDGEDNKAAQSEAKEQAKEQQEKAKEDAKKRKEAIKSQIARLDAQARATGAFAEWQQRMQSLLVRAGKRNIVNKYVWDADGGLRSETQSFANTVEHSVGCEISHEGGGGLGLDVQAAAFKLELNLIGSGSSAKSATKGLSQEKSFELTVDLAGLEPDGITALDDTPLQPGEKVDRYRMMTFYLEGDTKHFHEFFRTVVDPEWLISNDEEARALRQVQAGKPNRCWRVLHRVTYVERPALMGFGRDVRALKK